LIANYTPNDENYVSKYSKISFDDDSNALKMRNSEHSKKYQNIQLKLVIKFGKDKKQLKNSTKLENNKNSYFETTIPLQCTLINPSLRCQINQSGESSSQNINIIVFN
jgi:hypothetical protein